MSASVNFPVAAAMDKWSTRSGRLRAFWAEHGIGGVVGLVQRHGLGASAGFVSRNLHASMSIALNKIWDRRRRVRTTQWVELDGLAIAGPNRWFGTSAVSTSPGTWDYLSRYFPEGRGDWTYIDLGSGQGRTLLMASTAGFRKAIGVEFAQELCGMARENVRSFAPGRPRCPIAVHWADMTQFELPCGRLLIYLCNPILPELWPSLMENLVRTLDRGARMRLVVAGSQFERLARIPAAIEATGRFEWLVSGRTPYFADAYLPYDYHVFESL